MDISKVTDGIRKVLPLKYCGAVIVAAGTASRMGGIDKVMAELEGEPMILRTVRTFQTCEAIREIIIVALVVLLLFGGKKIPELMKGIGKGVKSFKDGLKEVEKDIDLDETEKK